MAAGDTGRQQPQRPDGSKPGPQNQVPGSNLWFWWVILAVLAAWNILALWPHGKQAAHIPYTTFLAQVRADNVSQVHIVGDSITGDFVKPILWPQPPHTAQSSEHQKANAGANSQEKAKPQAAPSAQPSSES